MQMKQLEAKVRHQDGVAIIDMQGEIDAFGEQELNRAYSEAEKENPPTILLNFSSVDYINSTGIALIVSLLAQARKAHRRLLVYGLSQHYQEIFEITRLADFMNVFQDEESALAAAANKS
jgi:anti-anti-sigma factor